MYHIHAIIFIIIIIKVFIFPLLIHYITVARVILGPIADDGIRVRVRVSPGGGSRIGAAVGPHVRGMGYRGIADWRGHVVKGGSNWATIAWLGD